MGEEKTKSLTKAQIVAEIATETTLDRKDVARMLDSLNNVIKTEMSKKGVGEFILPGIVKFVKVSKPATPAKKMAHPFKKGEIIDVKPKPAHNVLKIRPLKNLKDMVV